MVQNLDSVLSLSFCTAACLLGYSIFNYSRLLFIVAFQYTWSMIQVCTLSLCCSFLSDKFVSHVSGVIALPSHDTLGMLFLGKFLYKSKFLNHRVWSMYFWNTRGIAHRMLLLFDALLFTVSYLFQKRIVNSQRVYGKLLSWAWMYTGFLFRKPPGLKKLKDKTFCIMWALRFVHRQSNYKQNYCLEKQHWLKIQLNILKLMIS